MKTKLLSLSIISLLFGTVNSDSVYKENMKKYTIIERPSMTVIGIECRTSNSPNAGPQDIPKHWEKFYTELTFDRIPNKISNEIIALYCDYEGDYTKPYSLVIGCPVNSLVLCQRQNLVLGGAKATGLYDRKTSCIELIQRDLRSCNRESFRTSPTLNFDVDRALDVVPKGMVAKTIPAGSYAVFRAVGEHPKTLIETWGQIWQKTDLQRTYTGDYEVYHEKFFSQSPKNVDVYVAVQKNAKFEANKGKFAALKALNLPTDQYAITGSGALGIRNLREIGDIDIIVTQELWSVLEKKYGVTDEDNIKKIVFPDGIVEAFGENSFYSEKKEQNAPKIVDRIANAEIIEGLPFESLEDILYYKRKMNREKDGQDIEMIENLLSKKTTPTSKK